MSIIKAIKHVLGMSPTPANNFVLDASADNGTMKLARQSGQDIITVAADGGVSILGGIVAPSAGQVGELRTVSGGPANIGNGTVTGFGDFTLTPGVWDIQTQMSINPTDAGCTLQHVTGLLTAGTLGNLSAKLQSVTIGQGITSTISGPLSRLVITENTTIYCVARAFYTAGTVSVSAVMTARRVA